MTSALEEIRLAFRGLSDESDEEEGLGIPDGDEDEDDLDDDLGEEGDQYF